MHAFDVLRDPERCGAIVELFDGYPVGKLPAATAGLRAGTQTRCRSCLFEFALERAAVVVVEIHHHDNASVIG